MLDRRHDGEKSAAILSLTLVTPDNEDVELTLTRSEAIPSNPTTAVGRYGKTSYWKSADDEQNVCLIIILISFIY